jgi:hypothetical protein
MKKIILLGLLLMGVVCINGCALTADQKSSLEKVLKSNVDGFVNDAVQGNWEAVFAITTGKLQTAEKLKENLKKSLPDNSALTGGEVASMAWEDDKTAKVKINWAFRSGSTSGFSSETFVWVLKGGNWKYEGRAIR